MNPIYIALLILAGVIVVGAAICLWAAWDLRKTFEEEERW